MEGEFMNKTNNNLQDIFLNGARKNRIPVTIHLVNGSDINGKVTGFDSYTVVLNSEGKQKLVYKHAISTISPAEPILYNNNNNNNNNRSNNNDNRNYRNDNRSYRNDNQ